MNRFGLFCCGSLAYAIPLPRMRKIVHLRRGFRLPRLPAGVAEALVDDGALVPLLKLPAMTEAETLLVRTVEYKVLAESEAGMVAFPAAETCGIVAEQKGMLLEPDPTYVGVAGIFKYQGKEFKILDVDLLAIAMTEQV